MSVNTGYDIGKAFDRIENELIASMIRNMRRHKVEEIKEEKQWTMWQVEQLKALEKYKKENRQKYQLRFKDINSRIEGLIRAAKDEGSMDQELEILKHIKDGFPYKPVISGGTGEFFRLNNRKLEALIKATSKDMERAETAILRMAEDKYRQVIFNAQVYANTGAGTYEKAVDMATKDFLAAGINCVEYKNGARHTLSDYADMALRTAGKRAYLQGEGEKRKQWGIYTVKMNKRGNPCPKCLPFCGKVFIDDVWSGGPKSGISPVTGLTYPLMSAAVAAGLYHPRCRDHHSTYYEGISTPPSDSPYTQEQLQELADKHRQQEQQQYAERQAAKYARLAMYSQDEENQEIYTEKKKTFEETAVRNVEFKANENMFDTTEEWEKNEPGGELSELLEYVFEGNCYTVNQKTVILDYTQHEKDVAQNIATLYGKNVKLVPRITYPQGISTPDFYIDSVGWDLKTISTAGEHVLYNAVKKKKRQASNFIFDITNCPLDINEIEQQAEDLFKSMHLLFIDQVVIYKNNKIVKAYRRKK